MSTILIACERESEEQLLEQALGSRGYRVLKSRDGVEALEVARHQSPQLVLTNVVLPKMDGVALFRKCKQDERLQAVPFIFFSPRRSDPKYERFVMELGAKRFLHGAIKTDILVGAVDAVLAEAEAEAQPSVALAHRPVRQQSAVVKPDEFANAPEQLTEQLLELESLHAKLANAARFRALFELNPVALWLVNKADQKIAAANDAALALFGYARAEFLALSAEQLLNGSPSAFGATGIAAYKHKDGRALSLLIASTDIEFDSRAVELVAAQDASHRVRAERKVVDEAQKLRAVFAALPDGYCLLDGDGRILDVNEAFCQLTGFSKDELAQINISELEFSDAATKEQTRFQANYRRKDGSQWEADASRNQVDAQRRVQLIRPHIAATVKVEPPREPSKELRLGFIAELMRKSDESDEVALLQRAATHLGKAFECELTAIGVMDRSRRFSVLAVCEHARVRVLTAVELPSAWVDVIDAGGVLIRNEVIDDEHTEFAIPGFRQISGYLMGSSALSPQETCVLITANSGRPFDAGDQGDFRAAVEITASLLAGKRAHVEILNNCQRAEVSVQAMVDLLCRLVDQHDPHTAGSSNRVAALAVAIARKLGLGGAQQHAVYLAARLHDLGNIAIPREILARPYALNDYERALMRTHAEHGARLLEDVDLGAPVAELVHQHHERMNGSGYPRGLVQAEITLEARILAVADVVEAMCSPRPHRQALDLEIALAEISAGSGSLYDQEVVAACMQLFEEGFRWSE